LLEEWSEDVLEPSQLLAAAPVRHIPGDEHVVHPRREERVDEAARSSVGGVVPPEVEVGDVGKGAQHSDFFPLVTSF
jgi:hypothetical protein